MDWCRWWEHKEMSLWSSLGLFLNRHTHRGDLYANTKPEISDIVYSGSRHAVSIPLIYLILTYLEIMLTAASTLTAFICYFQMLCSPAVAIATMVNWAVRIVQIPD